MKHRLLLTGVTLAFVAAYAVARSIAERPLAAALSVASRASANVTLASDDARVVAVWAAAGSQATDIYLAASEDGGRHFGQPHRVNDREGDASVSGEQPPRAVVAGPAVHVVWASKEGAAAIRAAMSSDGGLTFTPARTITPAGIDGARGWESAAIDDDGVVHAAWLDGRSRADAAIAAQSADRAPGVAVAGMQHDRSGVAARQDIFHAMWRGTGPPIETRIATDACFCCKTALIARGQEVYAAWRQLFDGGIRDIAVARSTDGGRTFSVPIRVSADNWKLDACPDDGPALTLDERGALHVVWTTMLTNGRPHMGIFHAVSEGGGPFSSREQIDGERGTDPSHPRIATSSDGRLAAVWDEITNGHRQVALSYLDEPTVQVRILSGANPSSYPAIVGSGAAFVAAWTEQGRDSSRIIVEIVPR